MFTIKFKQAVHLAKVDYKKDQSATIDEETLSPAEMSYMQKLVNAGLAVEIDAPVVAPSKESLAERQKKLADSLMAKADAKLKASQEAAMEKSTAPEMKEEKSESKPEHKEEKSSSAKPKRG